MFAIFSSTLLIAQNKSSEEFVEDFLGTSKYQSNLSSNPGLIKFLMIKSTQGYKINEVPEDKFNSYPALPIVFYLKNEITANQFALDAMSPDFNFLLYSFPNVEKGAFRLNANDNTIIIIQSNEYINNKVRNK